MERLAYDIPISLPTFRNELNLCKWESSWRGMKNPTILMTNDHPPSFVDICGVCFFWKKICKCETHCRCPQLQENKTCEQTHRQTHQTRDVSIMVIYTWMSHLITLLLCIWLDFCSFDNLQSNFNDTHQRQFNWSSCGSFTTLQWTWAFLALSLKPSALFRSQA